MPRVYPPFYDGRLGAALLLLRVIAGVGFVLHGWPLVGNIAGFASGIHVPVWLAAVGAYTQVVGGLLLILGGLTALAALFLVFEMIAAMLLVHLPHGDPLVSPGGPSWELAVLYLTMMVVLLLEGPGAYSLDAWLMQRREAEGVAPAAVGRRRGVA